jgi:hypothetical protein
MTSKVRGTAQSLAFIRHLDRFPEDLRDIRRLQRRFRLSAHEASLALDSWTKRPRADLKRGTTRLDGGRS